MAKSKITLQYSFSASVPETVGRDGIVRYYDLYISPEDMEAFHGDAKALALKYGAGKEKA